ncbi:predicted protein [Sclerotinia sclerotiorum 1980 UF-70]|uniref:Uncharacterized protein n=1 Tax=Sclerotinia sclerotiorum (strain ATCC 18683 / 1980 / Ss-1) TaxID=665079 RepID=A7E9L8_SCLS1|nr:predicted protein [Sclerotinia sclerotiorum 1980 UF-70]EDN97070.1 predicted protein [Sclerotinia sclerotiorum 1980 UF-70]
MTLSMNILEMPWGMREKASTKLLELERQHKSRPRENWYETPHKQKKASQSVQVCTEPHFETLEKFKLFLETFSDYNFPATHVEVPPKLSPTFEKQ